MLIYQDKYDLQKESHFEHCLVAHQSVGVAVIGVAGIF